MFTRDREQGTVLPLSVPGTPLRKNRAQAHSVQVSSTYLLNRNLMLSNYFFFRSTCIEFLWKNWNVNSVIIKNAGKLFKWEV